jgi:hypothetical protein
MNRPYRQRFTPNRLPGRDDGRESAYESYRQAEFSNSHSGPPIHQGLTSKTVFWTFSKARSIPIVVFIRRLKGTPSNHDIPHDSLQLPAQPHSPRTRNGVIPHNAHCA